MRGDQDGELAYANNEFLSMVAEIAGEDALERLIAAHGGTLVYVPRSPDSRHVICKTLTVSEVEQISLEFGWGYVAIPLCCEATPARRRAAIRRMTAEGKSAREIARNLGVTQRTVIRHRRALRLARR